MPFGELVVLATKAHIYVNSVVELDVMAVTRGHEVGVVKDIIDRYEDANTQYQEAVPHFRSGATLDHKTKMQLIAHMV